MRMHRWHGSRCGRRKACSSGASGTHMRPAGRSLAQISSILSPQARGQRNSTRVAKHTLLTSQPPRTELAEPTDLPNQNTTAAMQTRSGELITVLGTPEARAGLHTGLQAAAGSTPATARRPPHRQPPLAHRGLQAAPVTHC